MPGNSSLLISAIHGVQNGDQDNTSYKKRGSSPFSDSYLSLMDAPLASPAPVGGVGACDSSVVPGCLILVLQNRGAVAAGRSPESVIHYQEHFLIRNPEQYSGDIFCSVETGMNRVSSHRNHENSSDGSPLQGPSRGTAGQITRFLYEYSN